MFDEIDFRGGVMPWPEPPRRRSWLANWPRIVLGIIGLGLLIGLLLPALQPQRHRDGRKLQCASNLRQLGLGINAYGQFPPGTIPNPDLPLDRRLGWGIPILPYIDQATYFADHPTTLKAAERLAVGDPVFADLQLGNARCPSSMTKANFVAIAGLGLEPPRCRRMIAGPGSSAMTASSGPQTSRMAHPKR